MRIQPNPHRIFARAEHINIADTIESGELVANLEQSVIAGKKLIERSIRRNEVHDHRDVGRLLFRCHADPLHIRREHGNGDGDAVLDQYLRRIQICSKLERDAQRHVAVTRALRGHVEHVLDAIDLLLDRRRNCFRYDFRVRAGIAGCDLNSWRRDIGILRDGQCRKRDQADERDDNADHAGENWPVDEKVRKIHVDCRCPCPVIFRFAIQRRFSLCPFRWQEPLQAQA